MRLLLIMNPAAGRRSPDHVEAAVRDSLGRRGIAASIETMLPRTGSEATAIARDHHARYDIVVAVGGDGTVRDVAAGLAGSSASRRGSPARLASSAKMRTPCRSISAM